MKNKKMILMGAIAALTLLTYSCKGDKDTKAAAETEAAAEKPLVFAEFTDLDLSAEGIPVVIKAPKDAKVIKSTTDGELFVYGGKLFKLTLAKRDGSAEDNVSLLKEMSTDKELNPSFDKLTVDEPTAYVKAKKDGELSFTVGVNTAEGCIIIQEGMSYDQNPDQFSDYSPADVQLMFDAAKTATAKQ